MITKFALDCVPVPMPDREVFIFWFDGNGKITYDNGSFDKPVANSFSLVQIQDCPFATEVYKGICYVHGLEKDEAEIHNKYYDNSRIIRKILQNPIYKKRAEGAFAEYINKTCVGGFRWHVSGDVFSLDYARFIGAVCGRSSSVRSCLHTRSFAYLAPLLGIPNLVVNLSADEDNYREALDTHERFGLRICYLTIKGEVPADLPDGSVIFPAHELRGRDLPKPIQAPWWQFLDSRQRKMVCPPDFFGQSESCRCGPCKKCLK